MNESSKPTRGNGYILAIGFAMTAAMWTIGYIGRIPPATAQGWLLVLLMALCIVAGGYCAGRFSGNGPLSGIWPALISAVANVMILGSVIGQDAGASLGMYLGASLIGSAILGAAGSAIGAPAFRAGRPPVNWMLVYASVAVFTTFLLIFAGGLVTSMEAGLAVVDWPHTEGQLMWLYPLAKMTGGIFFEHSHRLIGTLVGLTVLSFTLVVQFTRNPGWYRLLAWSALVLVVFQGILGGLRVTGHFTSAMTPELTRPNLYLAVVHGVIGQLFLCVLIALAVYASHSWKGADPLADKPAAATERSIGITVLVLLVVQLVFGAILRHLVWGLHFHLTLAGIVLTIAIVFGIRLWGIYPDSPPLPNLGKYLIWVASLQLCLGFLALIATGATAGMLPPPSWMVVIATAHQTTGAALLALATVAVLWVYRQLAPPANAGA